MVAVIHLIIQSIGIFIIVNIDEFLVLIVFFTKAIAAHHVYRRFSYSQIMEEIEPSRRHRLDDEQLTVFQIIAGQLIGFSLIIAITLLGSAFGLFIPYSYLALLGLVPFCLGLYELYEVVMFWKRKCFKKSTATSLTPLSIPQSKTLNSPYPSQYSPSERHRTSAAMSAHLFEQQYEMISSLVSKSYQHQSSYSSYKQNDVSGHVRFADDFSREGDERVDENSLLDSDSMSDKHHPKQPVREDSYDDQSISTFDKKPKTVPSSQSLLSDNSDDPPIPDDTRSASSSEEGEEEIKTNFMTQWFEKYFQPLLHPNIFYIALILLSDGSEEVAVFLPFLSTAMKGSKDETTSTMYKIGITFLIITIWYLLIFFQCFLAYLLIVYHYENYGKWISRYSKNLIPFILLGFGIMILHDSVLMNLL